MNTWLVFIRKSSWVDIPPFVVTTIWIFNNMVRIIFTTSSSYYIAILTNNNFSILWPILASIFLPFFDYTIEVPNFSGKRLCSCRNGFVLHIWNTVLEVFKSFSSLNLDITHLGLNICPSCFDAIFYASLKTSRFSTVDVDIGCLTYSVGFVFISEVTNGTTKY